MTTPAILETVERLGFTLRSDGDAIRIEGPKDRLTPDIVSELKIGKPQILAWLRDLADAEQVPLTDMQTAYLLGREEALELGGVSSHVFHEFEGDWDIPRLEAAFQRVIDRHDALRMRIAGDGARVLPRGRVRAQIPVIDARGAEGEARRAAIREGMSHQVMHTARVPLVEMRALRTDRGMSLFVSHDGLVIDGLSMCLFFRELVTFYRTPAVDLPPLGTGFAELSREMLPAADTLPAIRARQYWQEAAPKLPPAPALPLAADPARIDRPASERHTIRVAPAIWAAFRAAAAEVGLSPSAALGAAFCEVLSLWSGGADFTLNTTFANRPPVHPDAFAVIGNFTQPLPVPFRHGARTARERGLAFREALMTGLDHRSISGVEILQTLARPGEGTLRLPVTFNCAIDAPVDGACGSALAALGERVFAVSQTPQVWLNTFVLEVDDGLEIEIDAVAGLFPEGLVADFTAAYDRLIAHLADAAAWERDSFALLPERSVATRARVNDTQADIPLALVQDAFLARAAETPDAVALITAEGEITYGTLARRASAIAAWLAGRGDQSGKLVGVLMEKGWEQVAAALGILIAGGAYLPVAADLPPARIAEILVSAEAEFLLVQQQTARHVPPGFAQDRCLTVTGALDATPAAVPERRAEEQDALAYVLFTSGSTGKPKGVMVTHRNAVNLVADINARFAIGPDDRLFGISAFNFDLSVWDIFGALSAGAALVLPREADRLSPEAWAAQAGGAGVTAWNSVPAVAGMLLDAGLPPTLRLVLMSGDKVPMDLALALDAVEGLTVMSLGGPTETTVWNVLHPVNGLRPEAVRVPYGGPNRNNRLYVLDAHGRRCPDWVAGELHAAGAGVAKGYWKDPERTRASFFWHEALGERLYATGDVCFWRPDGVLEILGRTDFQVKINGLRVELSEIETRLAAHPAVEQAVACAVPGANGARLACAYVASGGVSDQELAAYLGESLPDYMVPGHFEAMEALPLTANGKVDRKTLIAALSVPNSVSGATSRPPQGDVEQALAAIWSDILKTDIRDATLDFAAFGGTSLAAVRIVSEIARRFGKRIAVRDFNRVATIEALARHLDAASAAGTAAE
jgi:pyochelin synthetase